MVQKVIILLIACALVVTVVGVAIANPPPRNCAEALASQGKFWAVSMPDYRLYAHDPYCGRHKTP